MIKHTRHQLPALRSPAQPSGKDRARSVAATSDRWVKVIIATSMGLTLSAVISLFL